MKYVTGNEATLLAYQALCAKAIGCPLMASRINGGIHASPEDAAAMSWDTPVEHPTTSGLFRHAALDPANSMVDLMRLTAQEQVDLAAFWAGAAELDSSWE